MAEQMEQNGRNDHDSRRTDTAVGEHVVEVFADIVCPFTHVGLRRFVEMREALGRHDVRLHVRAWPLEFVNARMPDASFIAEEIEDIREQVAPDLFCGFDPTVFPASSVPALALACRAYDIDLATGEAVGLELRDLLFEQGRDISDPRLLDELAVRFGIPTDTDDSVGANALVTRDHDEGGERGVIGSPHFFTGSGDYFCPALDIGRDGDGHLHVDVDVEGFRLFLDSCFP